MCTYVGTINTTPAFTEPAGRKEVSRGGQDVDGARGTVRSAAHTQYRVRNNLKVPEASKLLQWTHFVSGICICMHVGATGQHQVSSTALQI